MVPTPSSPSEVAWGGPASAGSRSPSSLSAVSDGVIVVPARGSETPVTRAKMLDPCTSPEFREEMENASAEASRRAAARLYERMKRHGLRQEAREALKAEDRDGERRRKEELMGMEFLLRDGFVSYLRDMARITPPIPQQVIRFSGIKYSMKLETSGHGYPTFGSKVLDCFLGPLKRLLQSSNSTTVDILQGVDGYVMPGSMTLLLGPPGSGKSSLLEILAGRTHADKTSAIEGEVKYNDKYASELRLSRLIAYVSGQLNKHIPFLTVRETLEFARDCTQGLRPENFTPQMRKFFAHALVEGQDPFLEFVLEILNLKRIENELAGEAISDVDRQKLTTAELALGTYSIMLYDQPLSGCDHAATYDLVDTIRTISRIQQSSAVMSLKQLSQEVFDLFDRIVLLCEGHVLYQGPRQEVISYFTNLGFIKPSHLEAPEFLEDIASGDGFQYLASGVVSMSIEELVKCYKDSDHYLDVMRIVNGEDLTHTYWIESEPGLGLSLKTPSKYNTSVGPEPRREIELVVAKLSSKVGHSGGIESTGRVQVGDVVTAISINNEELQYLAVGSLTRRHRRSNQLHSMLKQARGHIRLQVERYKEEEEENQAQWKQFQRPFVQTWWKSTKTLILRQMKVTKRLHMLIKLRLFQAILLGLFTGTFFSKMGGDYTQQHMNSVRALGFVSTMSIMLINLVQLPLYMIQRPIFYKHRAQRFFRASSYTVAHCIINLPQTFIEALAYTLCVYFPVRLSLTRGILFFDYLSLLFLVAYLGSSVFFFLSAISSIAEVGNALAGLIVSIFLLFSGFVIYPSNIPSYWKWLIYLNPIHWANVSFCNQQFTYGYTEPCTKYLDKLPFCNNFTTMSVGKAYLAYNQLSDESTKTWFPYAIILAWTVVTTLSALLALKRIEFSGTEQSLPQIKKTPMISNYEEDTESGLSSCNSCDEIPKESTLSNYGKPKGPLTQSNTREDDGGVGNWIDEFRVNVDLRGLGLPVMPVTLIFQNLSLTRYNRSKHRTSVFDGVTGYATPGTMLALLGGSNDSKITLLQCLSNRGPRDGILSGELQANGSSLSSAFTRVTAYVEKLDAHQPYLSVRESLQFSAALRLNQEISSMSRHIHVELVLDQLGLKFHANQLIGSLHGATGKMFEMAKRITIAVELAANPSILFLEEPISGLDTRGALNILRILYQLSLDNRIVIGTLSHPNARVLSFFHHALLLTEDGSQGYFGPIGFNCRDLLNYFSSIPKIPPYHQKDRPISFILEALGLGIKRKGAPLANFALFYQNSSLSEKNKRKIDCIKKTSKGMKLKRVPTVYPASYTHQAGVVLLRTQRFLWRNVNYTYGRLTGCIMIGLLMGSLYFQIEYSDTFGVTSRTSYIYMQIILIGVISANNVIPQIGTDRLVYFREKRAGMYLPIFYPFSWALGEIPYFLIATLAVAGIGNGMAGIATESTTEFFLYWLALFVFTICVTYFGMMLTFLAPAPILAAFAVSIVTSMWVSASGVVIVLSDIKFYRWMFWSNPFQYAIDALTSISFYCNTDQCGPHCGCPRLPDGTYVWDRLVSIRSLSRKRIVTDFEILAGMSLVFAGLAFLFLTTLKHNKPDYV